MELFCSILTSPACLLNEQEEIPFELKTGSTSLAHGEYIVAQNCIMCHEGEDKSLSGILAEKGPFGTVHSSNITLHPEYGIGQWTKEEFAKAVRYGQLKNGNSLNMTMPRFTIMKDQDIDAIWAYLKSVPILDI